jgi:hypothetical protein
MTAPGRARPLVAAVCTVPLLCEALSTAMDGIAEVQSFPAGREGSAGLLRFLEPDAVVVDTREEAKHAEAYARESGAPLVHVLLAQQKLRLLRAGKWREPPVDDASPESIRNVLVGALYGPRTVKA